MSVDELLGVDADAQRFGDGLLFGLAAAAVAQLARSSACDHAQQGLPSALTGDGNAKSRTSKQAGLLAAERIRSRGVRHLGTVIRDASRPMAPVLGLVVDLTRPRRLLVAENLMLRQQLLVLRRQIKRPKFTTVDRAVLVAGSAITSTWRDSILLVKPDTILRWHRRAFQLLWRWKSKSKRSEPRISPETIELIRRMADENHLWGAERIRGELMKLGIRVTKRTVQKYLRADVEPRPQGQAWSTFLKNHGTDICACDFLQTCDIWFRPIFAFFIVNL